MLNFFKHDNRAQCRLYNKILSLSRNKIFYTNFGLSDTFQNRIYLIFLHISFLNIKKNKYICIKVIAFFFKKCLNLRSKE